MTAADEMLAFAQRFAAGMAQGSSAQDHAEDLYGDGGMPSSFSIAMPGEAADNASAEQSSLS